jgi:uncharacterized membrane protein
MEFQIAVDIEATPEVVWSVMADVERWPEWTASVRHVKRLDDGPLRVGSRTVVRQPKLPVARWTVATLEPGHGFTWSSGAPGMHVVGSHWVEPIATGARATLRLEFTGWLSPMLVRLTRTLNHRYLELEAAGLKRRSEEEMTSARPR